MPPRLTPAEQAELTRRALRANEADLIRLVSEAGIPPDLTNLRTAATMTGLTCSFLRRAIKRGAITPYRIAGRLLIRLSQALAEAKALPRNR